MHYTTKTFTSLICKTIVSEFSKQNMILHCGNISFFNGLFRLSCTTLVYQIGGRQDAGPPGCSIQSDFNHHRRHHHHHQRHYYRNHKFHSFYQIHIIDGWFDFYKGRGQTLLCLFQLELKMVFSHQTQIFLLFCPDPMRNRKGGIWYHTWWHHSWTWRLFNREPWGLIVVLWDVHMNRWRI